MYIHPSGLSVEPGEKPMESSKLSMAVYFADYVDSTTGILGAFEIFDANGDAIPCDWGFTADQADDSCMIWTRFDEPIEPESIYRLTFDSDAAAPIVM